MKLKPTYDDYNIMDSKDQMGVYFGNGKARFVKSCLIFSRNKDGGVFLKNV